MDLDAQRRAAIWNTFIGGFVAIAALGRRQFGKLQAKNMPVYFRTALLSAAGLLALWIFDHPDVLVSYASWKRSDVLQAYSLLTVIISMGLNAFYVEPITTKFVRAFLSLLCPQFSHSSS